MINEGMPPASNRGYCLEAMESGCPGTIIAADEVFPVDNEDRANH
jgi:hypothetical protein